MSSGRNEIGANGERTVNRRRFLAGATAAIATALSGCSLLGGSFPEEQPPEDLRTKTGAFVAHVESGEWEAATEPFTAEMRESMPPDDLRQTWADNLGGMGDYREVEKWGYREEDGGDAVFARVVRSEGSYDLKTVWNDAGKLAGVWIVNKRQS